MQPWMRWLVLGGSVIVIAVLFVALRPEDVATPTPSPTPTPTATGTPSASPSPTPSPTRDAAVIEVTVRGERVEGPDRPTIRQGEQVVLVVHADVTDHVHLHGYDLMADVAPGRPARIRLRASVPGVFEVELEDAGRPLLELEIAP
jgi:hypothetical protein